MNPLRAEHERAEATFIPFGGDEQAVEIVESFALYELEYGAIRKSAGLLDMPQRGVVELRGSDRLTVLNNMLTNEVKSLAAGQGRRALLLTRQGRIIADIVVLHGEERTLLDLDFFQAPIVAAELDKLIFTEDVQVADVSAQWHHLALHGPGGAKILGDASGKAAPALDPLTHTALTVGEASTLIFRRDEAGSPGHHLLVSAEHVAEVYRSLLDAMGFDPADEQDADVTARRRGRPVGWLAYNTARIEAGSPLFHIDFGPDSLPHETGILDELVSFTKGCYVGQEVVARMHNLGHPKRILCGLRFEDDRLPVAGTAIRSVESADPPIGAVTSSTLSPMLGNMAIAFAVMKWGAHREGTQVLVPAEGSNVPATVRERLAFIGSRGGD